VNVSDVRNGANENVRKWTSVTFGAKYSKQSSGVSNAPKETAVNTQLLVSLNASSWHRTYTG